MSLFNDTYCHFFERFITREQWNIHLCSSGHLHREAHGYWPAHLPQKKMTRDEKLYLQKLSGRCFCN